ncbi:hypothetical protein VM98_38360, partial [Streptomyces rubellomurinus subsp. indigoferus]
EGRVPTTIRTPGTFASCRNSAASAGGSLASSSPPAMTGSGGPRPATPVVSAGDRSLPDKAAPGADRLAGRAVAVATSSVLARVGRRERSGGGAGDPGDQSPPV